MGPKQRLLPGPDGTGRVTPLVKHRRSDRPPTFSFEVGDEIHFANTWQDELIEFITTALLKLTGDGRITTEAVHKGMRYEVSDFEAKTAHHIVKGKMVPRIELTDLNAPPPPQPPDETPPPRYA